MHRTKGVEVGMGRNGMGRKWPDATQRNAPAGELAVEIVCGEARGHQLLPRLEQLAAHRVEFGARALELDAGRHAIRRLAHTRVHLLRLYSIYNE